MSSQSSCSNTLTPLEKALKQSLLPPDVRDVYLYAFSRRTVRQDGSTQIHRPLPIVAVGSILEQVLEYFSKLLTSGFAESSGAVLSATGFSQPIREQADGSEYDYESDSDLDSDEEEAATHDPTRGDFTSNSAIPTPLGPLQGSAGAREPANDVGAAAVVQDLGLGEGSGRPMHRVILLPNIAHRTLRACIFYLYTGKSNFLPLRSTRNPHTQTTPNACGDAEPPPCSPKSMYRLAESYGMVELQTVAHDAIVARLTPAIIVQETFSSFFRRYDTLREDAISILSQHYHDDHVQQFLKETIEQIVCGKLPHSGPLLISLLGLRVSDRPLVRESALRPQRPGSWSALLSRQDAWGGGGFTGSTPLSHPSPPLLPGAWAIPSNGRASQREPTACHV